MLTSQQLHPVPQFPPFRFKELRLLTKQYLYDLYTQPRYDRKVRVVITDKLDLVYKMCNAALIKHQSEILGVMRKSRSYYIFAQHHSRQTLEEYINDQIKLNIRPCVSLKSVQILLKFLIQTLSLIQQSQPRLSVLTPKMLLIDSINAGLRFSYDFPIEELFIKEPQARINFMEENLQYAAPELVKELIVSNNMKVNVNHKQVIYSAGLIVLFAILGESFSKNDRLTCLEDKRDYKNEIKFKRKQIKIFYNEKNISKTLKLLLESDENMRDDFPTLKIKLLSRQFNQSNNQQQAKEEQFFKSIQQINTIEEPQNMCSSAQKKTISLYLSKNGQSILMKNSKNSQTLEQEGKTQKSQKTQEQNNHTAEVKINKMQQVEIRGAVSVEDVEEISEMPMKYLNNIKMFDQIVHEQSYDYTINIKKKSSVEEQINHNHKHNDSMMVHEQRFIEAQIIIPEEPEQNYHNREIIHYQKVSVCMISVVMILAVLIFLYDFLYIN